MKAKGRPKKNTNCRSNGVGPSITGILIPQVHHNAESDYDDSDELLERGTDSENEVEYTEYNAENDNPILEVGMKFASFDQFKEVYMNWRIKHMRQIYFTTNDKQRCICKCKHSGCPFHLFASPSKCDPTIQIKTLNINHRGPTVSDNFHMTPQWIARKYFNIFRADPTWNVSGIIAIVQKDLGYTIEYRKTWRAKQQALKWVYGDEGAQYGKMLWYRVDLLNTNPGSNVEIWRDECKFKGFYVCLAPLKEAFKSGCRLLISLDGYWLKGTYEGNLLAAITIDPNDCIFPVTVMLKGLIGAVKELFPEVEHRNCVRHMYQNFRQKHKGKALKDLVWNAARASNDVKFKICVERLEQEDIEARKWFDHPERPFQTWTKALFKTHSRYDMLLNNLCESFNRYILDARDKSIIALLKMIKNKLMKRLYKKKEWINKYQDGHNARGHYKYVNIVGPETRQPFETQDLVSDYVSLGYSNQFNHDTWDNSQLDVDLTNQSIITQEPRQQSTGVECVQDEFVRVTDIVNMNDECADYVREAQSAQDEGLIVHKELGVL
ncbi:hypothetical protein KY290_019898 [Solanum tuberosum]|uniref:Transposase MuDR plant domain-containing protein n=1 Tax=Solanum tuberosum TaxID=4113 RepID=A0ABQ7VLE3_SOLTU|nr:hypothetical protein KY290_019898 [Solanum tuberosum]